MAAPQSVYAMTYAGQPIAVPTPAIMDILERWIERTYPPLYSHPGWDVHGIDHLPLPAKPKPRTPRLNVLEWPTGASRWAVMYCLMGSTALDEAYAEVRGVDPEAGELLITRNGEEHVNALMYLHDVRPVFVSTPALEAARGLYVVTLVDERYYAWQRELAAGGFTAGQTWQQLLDQLCEAGFPGVVPTYDRVTPAGFGEPWPSRWYVTGVPIPLLIDAACSQIGLRFVRDTQGAINLRDASTAKSFDDARWTTYGIGGTPGTSVVVGGRGTIKDNGWGSPIPPASWAASYPGDNQTTITSTLVSLGLTEWTGVTGQRGATAWLRMDGRAGTATSSSQSGTLSTRTSDTAGVFTPTTPPPTAVTSDVLIITWSSGGGGTAYGAVVSGTTGTTVTFAGATGDVLPTMGATIDVQVVPAGAVQFAKDYYRWFLSPTDAAFRGVIEGPDLITGLEDRVEIVYLEPRRGGDPTYSQQPGPTDSTRAGKYLVDEGVLTRVVPWDRADRNVYGDRPPPGYTYGVKVTAAQTPDGPFKAVIRFNTNDGLGPLGDGPKLGYGLDEFVLFADPDGPVPDVGDIGVAVPDPIVPGRWSWSGPGQSGGDCNSCGFLLDFDQDTCLLLKARGGFGRCECAPEDPTNDDSGIVMSYDSTLSKWVGVLGTDADGDITQDGMPDTCCGCGFATWEPDPGGLTAVLTWEGVHTSCDTGGSGSGALFSQVFTQVCCGTDENTGRKFILYAGYGADPCDGEKEPCDNCFYARVECYPCPEGTCAVCDSCGTVPAPIAFYFGINGTATTGGDGNWVLVRDPGDQCGPWTGTCEGVTYELSVAYVPLPGSPEWTLTGNGAVYSVASAGCAAQTLLKDSGTGPASVVVYPVSLPGSLTCCCPVSLPGLKLTMSTAVCTVTFTDELMDTIDPPGCYVEKTGGGGLPPPATDGDKGFGVMVTCNLDGTFNVYPTGNYSGPPVTENIENEAVAPDILFSVTYPCTDPLCSDCPVSVTLTFTNM